MEKNRNKPSNKIKLNHIYGHKGIKKIETKRGNGEITIIYKLDKEMIEKHGASVAFKVKDVIREVNSTHIKNNYKVQFTCKDKSSLTNWYNNNRIAIEDDIGHKNVSLKEE